LRGANPQSQIRNPQVRMRSVSVTRMELLARKEQIELAQQGLDLLEQKRAALMRELQETADFAVAQREALQQTIAAARRALAEAESIAGPEAVRSAALAARGELPLRVKTSQVMGISVPVIEQKPIGRSVLGRGYAPVNSSVSIDEAADAFEVTVEGLLALAQSELRLQRLAEEIQRTSRRLNALENVVLPRLREERNAIEMALDERERADHFRLKLVKRARQKPGL